MTILAFILSHFLFKVYSNSIPSYNVCDRSLNDITDPTGFISSPGFPNYQSVPTECQKMILAPTNKLIKIWLFIDIKSDTTGYKNTLI